MLSAHFLVGLTEEISGFLTLLSLELGWAPKILCLPYPCQLKHGNSAYDCATAGAHLTDLTPTLRAEIDRLTAADLVVYQHAVTVYRARAASHGTAFDSRLAELSSPEYSAACEAKRKDGLQARCKQM